MGSQYVAERAGRTYHLYAFHSNVLGVAVVNEDHQEWVAYVRDVPGEKHSNEWKNVAATGAKLDQGIAGLIWPQFKKYGWRR